MVWRVLWCRECCCVVYCVMSNGRCHMGLDLDYMWPHAPMNHVKIFKGWPPRDAPSKLVHLRYKTFPKGQRGLVEMKNATRLSNKTSTARSCAEDQILENKNLLSKILNICTEG